MEQHQSPERGGGVETKKETGDNPLSFIRIHLRGEIGKLSRVHAENVTHALAKREHGQSRQNSGFYFKHECRQKSVNQ